MIPNLPINKLNPSLCSWFGEEKWIQGKCDEIGLKLVYIKKVELDWFEEVSVFRENEQKYGICNVYPPKGFQRGPPTETCFYLKQIVNTLMFFFFFYPLEVSGILIFGKTNLDI